MALIIKWNGPQFTTALKAEMKRRLRRAAADVARDVQSNISESARAEDRHGRTGSQPGGFPKAMTGALRRSIFSDLTDDTTAIVGVDQNSQARKYARRLEQGGVIYAGGKYMAIPISPEAKRYRGNIRAFPRKLVLIRRPGRRALLVEIPPQTATGRDSRKAWIIHWVLTPSVRIGQRSYLERTLNQDREHIKRIFEEPWNI